jgi:MFS family permease
VTIVGSIGPVLQDTQTLALSAQQIGAAASSYVVGAVCGALIFGWLTDRFGRRFVFYVTLIVYLTGVLLTAVSWNFWSFAAFRAITGMGIGGEYAAINSAIDELIPAKYRGRIDLMVNGSFWLGAAAGSGASLVFLDPNIMPVDLVRVGTCAVINPSADRAEVLRLGRVVPAHLMDARRGRRQLLPYRGDLGCRGRGAVDHNRLHQSWPRRDTAIGQLRTKTAQLAKSRGRALM